MNTQKAIEFLKNEINGDNHKAIEGIIELLQSEYDELKTFLRGTYDIYDSELAWAYNTGYIDALTDYTHNFAHYELNKLTILNDQLWGN